MLLTLALVWLATPPEPTVPAITTRHVVTLLALAVAGLVLYLLGCRIWPYAACTRCAGSGKATSPTGKAWRDCPRCTGTGKRLRVGRKFLDHRKETK